MGAVFSCLRGRSDSSTESNGERAPLLNDDTPRYDSNTIDSNSYNNPLTTDSDRREKDLNTILKTVDDFLINISSVEQPNLPEMSRRTLMEYKLAFSGRKKLSPNLGAVSEPNSRSNPSSAEEKHFHKDLDNHYEHSHRASSISSSSKQKLRSKPAAKPAPKPFRPTTKVPINDMSNGEWLIVTNSVPEKDKIWIKKISKEASSLYNNEKIVQPVGKLMFTFS